MGAREAWAGLHVDTTARFFGRALVLCDVIAEVSRGQREGLCR